MSRRCCCIESSAVLLLLRDDQVEDDAGEGCEADAADGELMSFEIKKLYGYLKRKRAVLHF